MSDRRGAPPPPRVMPVIPVVPWSSAPPPLPPRSFSTEPPPTQAPPSEPTLVRQEPIDPRMLMMSDPQRAEEIRDEARALVHQALEEALAPLHFRVNELERRLTALAQVNRTPSAPRVAVARQAPPPPFAPVPPASAPRLAPAPAFVPPPQPMAFAPAPQAAPMFMEPASPAMRLPPEVLAGNVALPRPPAMSASFDIDVPFDGARRKRKVLLLFGLLFLALLGGLLASMAMSYSTPH